LSQSVFDEMPSSPAGAGTKRPSSPRLGEQREHQRRRTLPPQTVQPTPEQLTLLFIASILVWVATNGWSKKRFLEWVVSAYNSLAKRLTPEELTTESLENLVRGVEATKDMIPPELNELFEGVTANAIALSLAPSLPAAFAEELGSADPQLAQLMNRQLSLSFRSSAIVLIRCLKKLYVELVTEKAHFQQTALANAQQKAFRCSRLPNFSAVKNLVDQFRAAVSVEEKKRIALEMDQLVSSMLAPSA
jgi:hypothetical protein